MKFFIKQATPRFEECASILADLQAKWTRFPDQERMLVATSLMREIKNLLPSYNFMKNTRGQLLAWRFELPEVQVLPILDALERRVSYYESGSPREEYTIHAAKMLWALVEMLLTTADGGRDAESRWSDQATDFGDIINYALARTSSLLHFDSSEKWAPLA